MQTILGSNGPIGQELAKELYANYTQDLRLVSRNPRKVNASDELVAANLLNYYETKTAIKGSEIVYFTVGLPMDSAMWEAQFITILKNVIQACEDEQSKLVFFDNTYMYPKDARPQTEETPFNPVGRKSVVRAKLADLLLTEMASGKLTAVICRAPEFYGPNRTKSITNTLIFNNLKANKTLKVPVSKTTLRTLIWTPDASRAMALIGNTPDAYGQTWHLPCDESLTYQDLINLAQQITGKNYPSSTIKMWAFRLGAPFNKYLRELQELLPRYQVDNLFVSDKFKQRFPEFKITSFKEGITQILNS